MRLFILCVDDEVDEWISGGREREREREAQRERERGREADV